VKIAGVNFESLVDGPGIRVVVFAQGCNVGCKNCHNPESWDMSLGKEYSVKDLLREIKKPRPGKKLVRGITFSGGEPFMQAAELAQVAVAVKKLGWDVTTYSGHTYEKLAARKDDAGIQALLELTDYLIDGPYMHEKRTLDIKFRGSSNQRLIDMNATRENGGQVVICEDSEQL